MWTLNSAKLIAIFCGMLTAYVIMYAFCQDARFVSLAFLEAPRSI